MQAPAPAAPLAPIDPPVEDVIVVVHGMGDQTQYETVRAVVDMCFDLLDKPKAVSLGALASQLGPPNSPAARFRALPGLGFAEVFWADIGRALEEHTLEGVGTWADTIVGRIQLNDERYRPAGKAVDPALVSRVLKDTVRAIAAAALLNRGAAKVGLGSADLNRFTIGFLGDVQLVAEFEPACASIVDRMDRVMDAIDFRHPHARVHLVAHSLGTVVALLGLLKANAAHRPWIARLRTLTTFGAPLDKFAYMWPALWAPFLDVPTGHPGRPESERVVWRNYVDRSDPIAGELDLTSAMVAEAAPGLFAHDAAHEHVYDRSGVPGLAHVEYFGDRSMFEHALGKVVRGTVSPGKAKSIHPPVTRPLARFLGTCLPWLACLLLFAGASAAAWWAEPPYFDGEFRWTAGKWMPFLATTAFVAAITAVGSLVRLRATMGWTVAALLGVTAATLWFIRAGGSYGVARVDASVWAGTTPIAVAGLLGALLQLTVDTYRPKTRTWWMIGLVGVGYLSVELGRGRMTKGSATWCAIAFVIWGLSILVWDLAAVWQSMVRGGRHRAYMAAWRPSLVGPKRIRPTPIAPPPPPGANGPPPP